jgi:hypothetical protein
MLADRPVVSSALAFLSSAHELRSAGLESLKADRHFQVGNRAIEAAGVLYMSVTEAYQAAVLDIEVAPYNCKPQNVQLAQ